MGKSASSASIRTYVWIPNTHVQIWAWLCVSLLQHYRTVVWMQLILRVCWPVSLAETVSFRFSERLCLKVINKVKSNRGQQLSSCSGLTRVHMTTQTERRKEGRVCFIYSLIFIKRNIKWLLVFHYYCCDIFFWLHFFIISEIRNLKYVLFKNIFQVANIPWSVHWY